MNCPNCGDSDFDIPVEKSVLEIWHCRKCGSKLAVHCHYTLDPSGMQRHDLFTGTAFIDPGGEGLKALLKLKKALSFAERFQPAKLDEQHRAGKLTWDLGHFLDFEVQQAEAECERIGIRASFNKET